MLDIESKVTRFDLEQSILACWGVTDDLQSLSYVVNSDAYSHADVLALIAGMQIMYRVKFEKLFSEFEVLVQNAKI